MYCVLQHMQAQPDEPARHGKGARNCARLPRREVSALCQANHAQGVETMKQGRSTGKPTKAQEARFHAIHEIGCIACRKMHRGWVPCHVHHLTIGGKHGQKRRGHDYTIGLCPWHHVGVLGDASKDGPSYAKQPRAFRERYGDDDVLLEQQNSAIERIKQSNPWRNTHAPE